MLLALTVAVGGTWLAQPQTDLLLEVQRWTRFWPDLAWYQLTWLGDTQFALTLFLSVMLWWRERDALVALLWSVWPATLLTHGLKHWLALPRPAALMPPEQLHIVGEALQRGSFPSGHTVTVFTLAGCLLLASKAPRRWLYATAALPLAMLIGLSRVAVGAHWPVDVAGGAWIGWGIALLGSMAARRWPPTSTHWLICLAMLTIAVAGVTLPVRPLPPAVVPLAWTLAAVGLITAAWTWWFNPLCRQVHHT